MSDEPALAIARRRIETVMRLIVARRGSAYRAGWRIWATAMHYAPESTQIMWPLWLLWGALTDWVEVKPEEADQAESAMRRAAHEWLALPDNAEAQRAYFDRWLYDEMGYERPNPTS
jgi:hypothetical protein